MISRLVPVVQSPDPGSRQWCEEDEFFPKRIVGKVNAPRW